MQISARNQLEVKIAKIKENSGTSAYLVQRTPVVG